MTGRLINIWNIFGRPSSTLVSMFLSFITTLHIMVTMLPRGLLISTPMTHIQSVCTRNAYLRIINCDWHCLACSNWNGALSQGDWDKHLSFAPGHPHFLGEVRGVQTSCQINAEPYVINRRMAAGSMPNGRMPTITVLHLWIHSCFVSCIRTNTQCLWQRWTFTW